MYLFVIMSHQELCYEFKEGKRKSTYKSFVRIFR